MTLIVDQKAASLFLNHLIEAFSQQQQQDILLRFLEPGEPTSTHRILARAFLDGPARILLKAPSTEAVTELACIVRKAIGIAAMMYVQPVQVCFRDYGELAGSRITEAVGTGGGEDAHIESHGSQVGRPVLRPDAVLDMVVRPAVLAVGADSTKVWGLALVLWG
jgi:hypothetical protein